MLIDKDGIHQWKHRRNPKGIHWKFLLLSRWILPIVMIYLAWARAMRNEIDIKTFWVQLNSDKTFGGFDY